MQQKPFNMITLDSLKSDNNNHPIDIYFVTFSKWDILIMVDKLTSYRSNWAFLTATGLIFI